MQRAAFRLHRVHVLGALKGERAPGLRLGPEHCIASTRLSQVLRRCPEIIFQRKSGHLEKREQKREHREKVSICSGNNLWRVILMGTLNAAKRVSD